MTHVYHEGLEGYHPEQILHDGCPECEVRGKNIVAALAHMPTETFERAWRRAAGLRASIPPSGQRPRPTTIAAAELNLLNTLWAIQVRFERIWPLGVLPDGVR